MNFYKNQEWQKSYININKPIYYLLIKIVCVVIMNKGLDLLFFQKDYRDSWGLKIKSRSE